MKTYLVITRDENRIKIKGFNISVSEGCLNVVDSVGYAVAIVPVANLLSVTEVDEKMEADRRKLEMTILQEQTRVRSSMHSDAVRLNADIRKLEKEIREAPADDGHLNY